MKASIVIVHFGNVKPTTRCISSIYKTSDDVKNIEVIVVDNNKQDHARKKLTKKFPRLTYIKSKKNNYCHALNVGTKKANNDIIVILNPDTIVRPGWLSHILAPFKDKKIGGVSSKVLFRKSKKINSLGIEEIDDFYYRDIGMNEEDYPNMKKRTIDYASGASVAYRKKALQECGMFDEDFVMYVEDVDIGMKMKKNGWKLILNPKSTVLHEFHGTGSSDKDLPWYFCNRNRFLIIAKHHPDEFAEQIENAHPYINKQFDYLYDFVRAGIYKLITTHPESTIKKVLPDILKTLVNIYPFDRVQNMLNEIELDMELRKPTVCLYDHALHFIGGGQKYGCTIAECLQENYDVTLLSNKPVTRSKLEKWYDLDLKKCTVQTIPLSINKKDSIINPSLANSMKKNPFSVVEDEVLQHDIAINVNMVPHVNALALKNIFICHFPDSPRANFFYPPNYETVVTNSRYTTTWLKKRWDMTADTIIYPPVDMKYNRSIKKQPIILSVSRFETTGSKKQLEMARAFWHLYKKHPKLLDGWKLILAGGSDKKNTYLKRVKNFIKSHPGPIEIRENVSNKGLKKLYAQAEIFWHACGLNQNENKNPHLIEHFGMTTVEAMQNKCAPIVINGGGQKEIITHKKNGFTFNTTKQLKRYTKKLIKNKSKRKEIQRAAYNRSKDFSKKKFQNTVKKLVDKHCRSIKNDNPIIPEAHEITFYDV